MADKFIDQDETQIYGSYAAKRIRTRLVGLIPEFDSALLYTADKLDESTALVAAAVASARSKDADQRKGTQSKAPLLKQATRLLGLFSKHLSTHDEASVDRKVYFVKDGTAGGVGNGAQSVLLAVTYITTKLGDPKSPVREAAHWHGKFEAVMKALGPAVAFADDARADRQSLTPEVEAARQAWLNQYVAAKSLAESALRNLGRLEQMTLYFYDLRVPAGTKVTEPPADEPEVKAGPEQADEQDDG